LLVVAAAQVVIDDDIARLGLFGSFPPLKILTATWCRHRIRGDGLLASSSSFVKLFLL
jgi:hypothetical protein